MLLMYRNSLLPVLDVASAVSSGKHALLSQERHDDGCRRIWQITLPYARSEGAEKLVATQRLPFYLFGYEGRLVLWTTTQVHPRVCSCQTLL